MNGSSDKPESVLALVDLTTASLCQKGQCETNCTITFNWNQANKLNTLGFLDKAIVFNIDTVS